MKVNAKLLADEAYCLSMNGESLKNAENLYIQAEKVLNGESDCELEIDFMKMAIEEEGKIKNTVDMRPTGLEIVKGGILGRYGTYKRLVF